MFVKLTDEKWAKDDKDFVLRLLHEEHVLVVHGSGFSPEIGQGHFRIVFLPDWKCLMKRLIELNGFYKIRS